MFAGCGGGGGGSTNTNTPPPVDTSHTFVSQIMGTVTDGNSGAIVGATVTFPGYPSVTTSQFGAFVIPSVIVPIGQTSVVGVLRATATVNGKPWSAQNTVEVLRGNAITDNAHLTMSLTSAQATITGTLTDSRTGAPLVNARVFTADGPYTGGTAPATYQFFSVFSSYTAYTDSNGNYTIAGLPPLANYTVTASYTGYINQTVNSIGLSAGATRSAVNFALVSSTSSALPPTVTGLAATSVTLPLVASRAAGDQRQANGLLAIKMDLLQKLGYLKHPATDMSRATAHAASVTRGNPAGSMIETIVIWDYSQVNNLLGFDILRSTQAINQFGSIALLRDPLGDRFTDDDPILTPETTYYYSVAMADTINFPKNGDEGNPAIPAVAVEPLAALSLVAPLPNATVAGTPTFSWSSVNRAATYTVMLYSQFPSYQSSTDPNGIKPIWTGSVNGSLLAYTGSPLTSGQTYYWAVLAQDGPGADFSISPIQAFTAQ